MDGVFEASEEFGVRWVAECGGQLLDGFGVVVLLVSICVRRVLGYPLGGLCGRGYRGQVLQVAVVWHVHMECQWTHPERHALEVASLGMEPVGPTSQEYGIKPELAH